MQGERRRELLAADARRFWPLGAPTNAGSPRFVPPQINSHGGLPVIVRLEWAGHEELVPAQAGRWTATAVLVRIGAPGAPPNAPELLCWMRAGDDVSSSIPPRPLGGWYRGHVSHLDLLEVKASRWPASTPLNERQPRSVPIKPQGDVPVLVRLVWHEYEELLPARAIRWTGESLDDAAMAVVKPPRGPGIAELVCWLAIRDVSTTIPRRPRPLQLHSAQGARPPTRRRKAS
jgi:hypothetical protein